MNWSSNNGCLGNVSRTATDPEANAMVAVASWMNGRWRDALFLSSTQHVSFYPGKVLPQEPGYRGNPPRKIETCGTHPQDASSWLLPRSAFRRRGVPGINPLKWTKRDRVVALVAGVPTTVAVLVIFRYVFPVHDYLSALFFGAFFGILGLIVEMLAVLLARRFADSTA